jgi:SAM-dependent methyltransferase
MKNSFQTHPEFIKKDFRANRPASLGLPVSTDLVLEKHQLLLPPEKIAGKRILDVGSFIGQTIDWCLSNGAAHVTGIEISKDFCAISDDLLKKYYTADQYTLINQEIEDFFACNQDRYDLIFCWGVLFSKLDHVNFLNQLAQRADHVIINSRHPKYMWNSYAQEFPDNFWHDLEYNVPYTEYQPGTMTMMVNHNGSAYCTAANSSMAALELIMEVQGFTYSLDVYKQLKTKYPDMFGMFQDPKKVGHFVIEFFRDSSVKKHNLVKDAFDPKTWKTNYVDWLSKNDNLAI